MHIYLEMNDSFKFHIDFLNGSMQIYVKTAGSLMIMWFSARVVLSIGSDVCRLSTSQILPEVLPRPYIFMTDSKLHTHPTTMGSI